MSFQCLFLFVKINDLLLSHYSIKKFVLSATRAYRTGKSKFSQKNNILEEMNQAEFSKILSKEKYTQIGLCCIKRDARTTDICWNNVDLV
jgi:hypothetical protein